MSAGDENPLLQASVFEDIPPHAVSTLCTHAQTRSYEAGHLLFERGDDAQQLMILQDGAVELLIPILLLGVTREVTMETKQAGEVVAWSSLVSPYYFTLSARCATDCTLVSFTREALYRFFDADPSAGYLFMRNLCGVIGRRLQAMQTMWMHDLQASAAKRME